VGNVISSYRISKLSPVFPRSIFKPSCSQEKELLPTQEDPRAKFYDMYRHEAEEYDRDFIKKYDEDLNTTLIFVSLVGWSDRVC